MSSEKKTEERRLCNQMRLSFPAISENEGLARSVAAAFAAQADPTMEELTEIRTALSEAVSNAVIHGYPQGGGEIHMELALWSDGALVMTVEDQGVGIPDVEQAREPLFTTGDEEERSGMGFTVMESFTDHLEVTSAPGKGTRVTMVKQLDQSYGL